MISHILVAIDHSAASHRAFDTALGYCQLNLPFLKLSNKLPSIAFAVSFRRSRIVV